MKIVINGIELNEEESSFIADLVRSGVEFQKETYNMAKDIALDDTPIAINDSLMELVGDEYEQALIMNVIDGNFAVVLSLFM